MQEESRIQGRNGLVKEENVALAAKTKKEGSLLLKRKVENLRGLLISQGSYATIVKNWATMLETVVSQEEDLEEEYFMHLLLI